MDIFEHFQHAVNEAIEELVAQDRLPGGLDLSRIAVEPPRDRGHGDITTNAAMVLAKPAQQNPRELAEAIADILRAREDVTGVDIAGPGFVNMHLDKGFWPRIVRAVLDQGDDYGRLTVGKGCSVNVEYVSANPTGPLHVGHCRGAVVGDALANLLAFCRV